MKIEIKTDITEAKAEVRQKINARIQELSSQFITHTDFASGVYALKRAEIERYSADPAAAQRNQSAFPYIEIEMQVNKCSFEEAARKIALVILAVQDKQLLLERLRREALLNLEAANSYQDVLKASEINLPS